MVFYTLDGQQVSEDYMGPQLAFRDEAAAVAYFDKKAAEANSKANPGFFDPTGVADRAAHAYMQLGRKPNEDPGPNPNIELETNRREALIATAASERIKLERQLAAGEITPFEFKKQMDALSNPASDLE